MEMTEKEVDEEGGEKVEKKEVVAKEKPNVTNVLILSFGFQLLFAAFSTAQGYMTTLHPTSGHIALGILYIVFSFASFVSPLIISLAGVKISLTVSSFFYVLLIFSTGVQDMDYLLYTLAALVGLFASVLWTAHGMVLTESAKDKMGLLSGVFWAIFQVNSIIGFFLSGILKLFIKDNFYVFLVYGWIGTVGILLFFFVVDVKKTEKKGEKSPEEKLEKVKIVNESSSVINSSEGVEKEDGKEKKKKASQLALLKKSLFSTFRIIFDLKFIGMIPTILHNGYSYGFYFGTCTSRFGEDMIAWTFTAFAIAEFLGSLAFGRLTQSAGNRYCYYVTFFFHAVSIAYTYFLDWNIIFLFFTISFCGLADAALNTTLYSILGKYFKKNSGAAFAGLKFIQSFAICFEFFTEGTIQFSTIQIILFSLIGISVLFFAILDTFISPVDRYKGEEKSKNLNILDWVAGLFRDWCCKDSKKDVQTANK